MLYQHANDIHRPFSELTALARKAGFYGNPDTSLECFQIWKMSGFQVLPYGGSWLDQPTWVLHDFRQLLILSDWHDRNAQLAERQEVPSIGDVLG